MKKIIQFLDNNKFTSFFLNEDNFVLVYTAVCLLWCYPFVLPYADPLNKICFAWGIFLIAWDFFTKRRMFKTVNWGFPLLLIFCYAITILVNIRYDLYMNIKHIIYLSLDVLILYGRNRNLSKEKLLSLLKKINNIIIVFSFVADIASILMFVFKFQKFFYIGDMYYRQGFLENRLFGVYTSPNVGALMAIVSFGAMMLNALIKNGEKIKFNWFYICNSVVQVILFSLTLSKGGLLTAIAFEVLFVIVYVFPKIMKKGMFKSIVASVLLIAVLVGGSNFAIKGIRYVMSYIPNIVVNTISSNEDDDQADSENKVVFERIESGDDMSNGRFTIWSGSLKLFKQSPLFGFGDLKVDEDQKVKFDISELNDSEQDWLYKHQGNLHNIYVQVLVLSGVVGFAALMAFAISIVKKLGLALINGRKDTQLYNIIAVLFVILGVFAANGMVESHLIFRMQNVFCTIFWAFAGIAVLLSEVYQNSEDFYPENSKNSETSAFVIAMPFQAMNEINFVLNDVEKSKGKSDAYIYHMFKGSEELSERIKESGVFNNVYDFREYKEYNPVVNKFVTLIRLFNPKLALKMNCKGKIPLDRKNYKSIYVSYPLAFMIDLHNAFPRADVFFIEDGTGAYFGNIADRSSNLFKKIDKIFFDGQKSINPIAIYYSNPQLSKSTLEAEKRALPTIDKKENLAVLEKIFGYKENSIYRDNKIIYLTQPLEEREGFIKENQEKIEKVIEDTFSSSVVARVHPRHFGVEFDKMQIDTYANLWELECINQISDENVLIGAFSTSQFMPKILKNVEPTIIFTYKMLFTNLDDEFWKGTDKFIADFKSLYSKQNKIYVPETLDELEKLLAQINDAK